ncbi:GTP-binding protein [archaeon]|jgi:Ras-related protein Rab-11A|nr:Rab family GTPase [Asgard group archaeon]NDB28241.1 GTP-binding protein [archaeon]NDB54595.1 GTP-binding protein [archaeon]NDB78539.1 GTP-binding protein [archaeon]NDF28161.1 GTP-binding protein [archaeon]|tara:strand:+ start:6393 stop:7022 length:630 start_codon:yes stop_codon:yes gene_type:complete
MFWKKKEKSIEIKSVDESSDNQKYFLKIVLLGDGAVGKTNIRKNYLGQGFTKDHLMTIGADFAAADKVLQIEDKEYNITFQIWDLAGQGTFNQVRSMYYRGVFGALVVFDVTRKNSFDNLSSWIKELYKNSNRGAVPIVILGNKYDLFDEDEDHVKSVEINDMIELLNKELKDENFNVTYLNTSALTGLNIENAFESLGSNIINWLKSQ